MNDKKPFHSSTSDINIPVVHERTASGNSIKNGYSSQNDYLLTNDPKRKRFSLPAQIDVDSLTRTTPDRMTPNYKRGIFDDLCKMIGGRRMFFDVVTCFLYAFYIYIYCANCCLCLWKSNRCIRSFTGKSELLFRND